MFCKPGLIGLWVMVMLPAAAEARWGAKAIAPTSRGSTALPGQAVPADPPFYKKLFGRGHDPVIRQGIREAKRGYGEMGRDLKLLQLTQDSFTLSRMSRWSVRKIAAKTKSSSAHDGVLENFAKYHLPRLSLGDVVGLSSHLNKIDTKDGMLASFRASHPNLSVKDQQRLFRAETFVDGGHHTCAAAVYNPRTHQVERRYSFRGGVAGVYNPDKGEVEWKSSFRSGVAGVYNPSTRKVEWNEQYLGEVAGAYNPKDGKVYWASGYKSGAAAVYNPKDGTVHTKVSYMSGVAGAYNPKDGKVHFAEEYKSGVAAVYDPKSASVKTFSSYLGGAAAAFDKRTGTVQSTTAYKGGVAALHHDGITYRSQGGFNLHFFADEL